MQKAAPGRNAGSPLFTFGVILAISSLLFGFGWKLDFAKREELQRIEGRVTLVQHTNLPKAGRKIHIYLHSADGSHHLTQDELTYTVPRIADLQVGDSVVAHAKPDFLGRDLEWLWELERNGQMLLTYEETLRLHRSTGDWMRAAAYVAAAASALFFALGIFVRTHERSLPNSST